MTSPAGRFAWEAHADLVVVGGGVAGLTAARTASLRGLKVLTVSKGGPTDTATQYAQGGIAVVDDLNTDSVESHVSDTCEAGVGLCDEEAVYSIVEAGHDAVAALAALGAVFDRGRDGEVSRTREVGTARVGSSMPAATPLARKCSGLSMLPGSPFCSVQRQSRW